MTGEEACTAFLAELAWLLDNEELDFVLRDVNKEALSNLGISIEDAKHTILELTIDNYYKGPTEDHRDSEQTIWEFGIDDFFIEAEYPSSSLYLKIVIRPSRKDMAIISFHEAKFPIKYPFKGH